jgi:hypothetical protein
LVQSKLNSIPTGNNLNKSQPTFTGFGSFGGVLKKQKG